MIALLGWIGVAAADELTLWHAWRGEERAALEALCDQYEAAHPGAAVAPLAIPYESLSAKLEAAIPRGNGPDLFIFAHERVADWSARELILPLEPQETGADSGFMPSALAALRWEGRSWGLPLGVKSLALFYNRALLPEGPPQTIEELLADGQADQTAPDGKKIYRLAYEVASAYHAAPWMHATGGGIFDSADPSQPETDGPVRLGRPANVAAFALIRRMALELVPPEPSGALVNQLFNEGRAAMLISGPWFLGEIASGLSFGVAPLPTVAGRPAAPWLTVEAVFLAAPPAGAAADPAAADLARFLAGAAGSQLRQNQGRQIVARTDVPAADPVLAAFREQAAAAIPMPLNPAMAQTWEPLARSLRRLTRGAGTPELAAAEAQTAYEILSRPLPPAADPAPWLIAAGIAGIAGLAWLAREIARAPIRAWAFAYAWVAPAFGAMTLLTLAPFLVGAAVSLFELQGQDWTFVGFSNFLDILLARDFPVTSPLSFWSTLLVTVLWTVCNVVLHVGIGVALALLLREPWVRLRGVFRAALILPWAIPSYITALIWKNLFHAQFGAINALLGALGIAPVSWFASFSTAFAANLCTNTWLGFPFMMVVTLGALQSIPRDLEEAAEVDGADGWQRLRHVTLPMLAPALLPAVILGSVWTFNMFNIIYLVSGGEPDGSTEILISQAYRWAFTRGHRYGYASAYAVIIFGVLLIYGRAANRLAGKKVI